jgi:hypothetical protein
MAIGTDGLKPIESASGFTLLNTFSNSSLSGNKLLYTYADIDDLIRPYGNLFKSFNFPIIGPENTNFELTYNSVNKPTALATLNRKKIIVVEIPKGEYGELIDGKTFQLTIPVVISGVATATTVYGTYFGFSGDSTTNYLGSALNLQYSEVNRYASQFGLLPSTGNNFNSNVTFLFSNDIQKPKNITGTFELYKSAITLNNNNVGTELQLTGMTLSSGNIIKVTVTSTETPQKDISTIRVMIRNQTIYSNTIGSGFLTVQPGISSENPIIWDTSTTFPTKNIEIKIEQQNSSDLSWNVYSKNNKFPPNSTFTNGKMYARYVGNDLDKPVGILYNDKGIAVITDPTLVSGFRFSAGTSSGYNGINSGLSYNLDTNFAKIYFTSTTLSQSTFQSITSEFVQNITCIAMPNEFTGTTNSTYDGAYDVNATEKPFFITTIGLYNQAKELIGIGKLSEPVKKTQSNVIPFNIKLII